jgi:hypothetical protein
MDTFTQKLVVHTDELEKDKRSLTERVNELGLCQTRRLGRTSRLSRTVSRRGREARQRAKSAESRKPFPVVRPVEGSNLSRGVPKLFRARDHPDLQAEPTADAPRG